MIEEGLRAKAARLLKGITPGPWTHEIDHRGWEDSIHYAIRSVEKQVEHPWSPRFIAWMNGSLGSVPAHRWPEMASRGVRDDPRIAADAEFIAACPTLVTGLLLALDKAEQQIRALEQLCARRPALD